MQLLGPVLVIGSHFHDDGLDILVGCFDCPIGLWAIRRRAMMLNLVLGE